MIVKEGNKWVVRSHTGKNLGRFNSKAEARRRLGQVEFFKKKRKKKK